MRRKTGSVLAVLGAVLLSAATALAQGPGGGMGGGRGPGRMGQGGCPGMSMGMGIRAIQELNLTPDQQKQMATLETKLGDETAPLRAQMDAKRAELQGLWTAQTPDRKAILAKQAEMDRVRDSLRTAVTDYRLGVLNVLTPDQRAKLASMPHGPGGFGSGGGDCPMCGDGG
jgi:Spy/CpxP family protein refolding chaperone